MVYLRKGGGDRAGAEDFLTDSGVGEEMLRRSEFGIMIDE